MSKFRTDEVIRESVRSVIARLVSSLLVAATAILVGVGTIGWSWLDSSAAHADWVSAHLAGIDTLSVRASSAYPIDSSRCDALRSATGVEAAGAIIRAEKVSALQAPTSKITLIIGTPGLAAVAYPSDLVDASSVVVGNELAGKLGIVAQSTLSMTRAQGFPEVLTVDAVSHHAPRMRGFANSVLVAEAANHPVAECLVTALPGAYSAVAALLQDWFGGPGISIVNSLPTDTLRRDPVSELRQRASTFSPLIGAALLSALVLGIAWSRRQEVALYRLLGLTRPGLLLLNTTEVAVTVLLPCGAGMLITAAAVGAVLPIPVAEAMIRDGVSLVAALATLPLLMTCLSAFTSPVDIAKGR